MNSFFGCATERASEATPFLSSQVKEPFPRPQCRVFKQRNRSVQALLRIGYQGLFQTSIPPPSSED
jgi:hypothetical protein